MKIRCIAGFAATLILLCSCGRAQDWQLVPAPLCAIVTIKRIRVSRRPYTIYKEHGTTPCCKGLPIQSKGQTDPDGQFKVTDIRNGHYFVVFDLKGDQLIAPLDVQGLGAQVKDCGSVITVIKREKDTGKVSVESFRTMK